MYSDREESTGSSRTASILNLATFLLSNTGKGGKGRGEREGK